MINHSGWGISKVALTSPLPRAKYDLLSKVDRLSFHPYGVRLDEESWLVAVKAWAAEQVGLNVEHVSSIEYHFGTSETAAAMGWWHGDDDCSPGLAVWLSLGVNGDVPPSLSASRARCAWPRVGVPTLSSGRTPRHAVCVGLLSLRQIATSAWESLP